MKRNKLSKGKYTMYNLRRKRTLGSGMELSPVFKKMNKLRNEKKQSGDLREISHPAKFSTCKKELKKSLEPGVVRHAFNPSTEKAEAGRSLSLSPA